MVSSKENLYFNDNEIYVRREGSGGRVRVERGEERKGKEERGREGGEWKKRLQRGEI